MQLRSVLPLLVSAPLFAQTLVYSNGPLQTGVDVSTGNNISVLQTAAPLSLTVYGFGAQQAVPNRLADQFAVCAALVVDQIEVFGYATGVAAPVLTDLRVSIYDNDPSLGPANELTGAGTGINLISAAPAGFSVGPSTFTGIYRVLDTGTNATNRPIHSVRVTIPSLTLVAGVYWVEFSYTGYNFCPPVTTLGYGPTGDAKQLQTATWVNVLNGTFQNAIPFNLYSNSPIGLPGGITNLGGSCSTATFDVQGSPAVGGYLTANLTNVNPLGFGAVIVGASDPGLPLALFGCGCVQHASLDNILFGSSNVSFGIPVSTTLCGAELYLQGAQFDLIPVGGITSCNVLGINLDLTDGFRFRLW